MPVTIAEYFGQKTDLERPVVKPVFDEPSKCPFMDDYCLKLSTGNKPICCVRLANDDIWIVCRHRLCATKGLINLTEHQRTILLSVAKTIFGDDVDTDDIIFKREQSIPVVGLSKYHADFIMINNGSRGRSTGQKRVILEMQGGGETSNTGYITRHVQEWEEDSLRTNEYLRKKLNAGAIVTNAWRRQQEQFIIKGNISMQTGGGIVFCVGKPLYDYLWARVKDSNLNDLSHHNWTLALIGFSEVKDNKPGPIKFEIDKKRILFTNYLTFIQTLINQGLPYPLMFEGNFETLSAKRVTLRK